MERVSKILNDSIFQESLKRIGELEKDRRFCCHGMDHLESVARIAWILTLEEKKGLKKDVVYGAALLHDIGRCRPDSAGQPHRVESAAMAEDILFRAGYTDEERMAIREAILSHGGASKPAEDDREDEEGRGMRAVLSDVLYRADKLSRDCFACSVYDECYWEEERKNKTIIV